ncbi:hypothetical protein RJ640_021328 [Escallonia rubra]|uniref:Flotillin-like n=1 Tax=Escallonia rubra TaxID=112253 RepID=A0AA88RAX4_9ASTE|nr:hypothetical protein RJ640_021328 [Escallonia rubra]
MYKVAGPSEVLAITGSFIQDIKLAKKKFIFPGQKCIRVDISPVNYTFDVQAMSAEKLSFVLPAVFTIGPRVDDHESMLKYAKLISSHDKLSSHVQELVKGVIEGETRIYNANVKQLVDVPGHEYFSYLGQKTQMEAANQAKERDGLTVQNAAKIDAETKIRSTQRQGEGKKEEVRVKTEVQIFENQREAEVVEANTELAKKKAVWSQSAKLAEVEAAKAVAIREAELQREVEKKNALTRTEKLKAENLSKASVEYDIKVQEANSELYKKQKAAEGVLFESQKIAEANKASSDASLYTRQQAANAELYAMQREAEGIAALAQAQGSYLRELLAAVNGDYKALRDFIMIDRGIPQEMARLNASAVQGLQPKISIWSGANGDQGGGAMKDVAGVYKMLPPLFQTLKFPHLHFAAAFYLIRELCLVLSMEGLPDQLVGEILDRIKKATDKSSIALTCKRFHGLDNERRNCLRVGCGLHPANEALISLCNRFPNLTKVEIVYSGWMSKLGKQLDDQGLHALSTNCPFLTKLTLSHCTFITDAGLSYLASCSKLSSLKLIFTPRITGCGILSLVVGCKNLRVLHLIRCLNISSAEWIEYLGKLETLENLFIKNCRAIGEGDLVKLGPSWKKIKRLQFEVDSNYRYMKVYDRLAVDRWLKQCIPCENMVELSLVNCIIIPGRGLACILGKCKNLEKVHLDMCVGVRDCDIVGLALSSRNLRSISLRVPSDFSLPLLMDNPLRLTDESLKSVAQNCSQLESVRLSFYDGEFPSLSSFTLNSILFLVQMCPIRKLSLDHAYFFNDVGMAALCSAQYLHTLELVRCQEISDEGLQLVGRFTQLCILRLSKCLGITDDGLKPLRGSYKLESLSVDDCPQISERGIQGAAKSVTFKQDL